MNKIFFSATFLILLDQLTKVLVKTNMVIGESIHVFNWFYIYFIENNGMAFGLEFGGEFGKLFLTLFRMFVVLFGILYLYRLKTNQFPTGVLICIGLILGGAISNIIDSVLYGVLFSSSINNVAQFFLTDGGYAPLLHGKVVDMLYFPIIDTHIFDRHFVFFRPVFNIADSGITTGIMLILIFYRKLFN